MYKNNQPCAVFLPTCVARQYKFLFVGSFVPAHDPQTPKMTTNESPNVERLVDLEKSASAEHVSTSGTQSEVELNDLHGFTENERKKLMHVYFFSFERRCLPHGKVRTNHAGTNIKMRKN